MQVNIVEAKKDFSKLVRILESRREDSITVSRNGKPIVRITLIQETPVSNRIGIGKGRFTLHGDFDADNTEISEALTGGTL